MEDRLTKFVASNADSEVLFEIGERSEREVFFEVGVRAQITELKRLDKI